MKRLKDGLTYLPTELTYLSGHPTLLSAVILCVLTLTASVCPFCTARSRAVALRFIVAWMLHHQRQPALSKLSPRGIITNTISTHFAPCCIRYRSVGTWPD
jgi:hypothetical protein